MITTIMLSNAVWQTVVPENVGNKASLQIYVNVDYCFCLFIYIDTVLNNVVIYVFKVLTTLICSLGTILTIDNYPSIKN